MINIKQETCLHIKSVNPALLKKIAERILEGEGFTDKNYELVLSFVTMILFEKRIINIVKEQTNRCIIFLFV
jgi:hypothetical protein